MVISFTISFLIVPFMLNWSQYNACLAITGTIREKLRDNQELGLEFL